MFTGLITAIGTITAAHETAGGKRLTIVSEYENLVLGESIACNGACLTVVAINGGNFDVELSSETLACTEKTYWQEGGTLNLERALQVGDRLGGHFVTGHVDGLAELMSITPHGDCFALTLRAPQALSKFIAAKGSVTLNGISLTVNRVENDDFEVMIIPHTWQHTTLNTLQPNAHLHLEIDLLARYLERVHRGVDNATPLAYS
jgi:riboflavin synthase